MPPWCSAAACAGAFVAIARTQRERPLRRSQAEPWLLSDARNLAVAATAAAPILLIEVPLTSALAKLVDRRRLGLVKMLPLPPWLEAALAVALLDYTLYWWHRLAHRVPFLWSFHLVHHIDRNLDATTALRFHPGEMTLSVAWRVAQVAGIGVAPLPLSLWQTLLVLSILFHHANVRLSPAWERRLATVIVTPRLHDIHHRAVKALQETNWSSGLTLWDRIHGSLRTEPPERPAPIGLPAYRRDRDVALSTTLALPFTRERDAWTPS